MIRRLHHPTGIGRVSVAYGVATPLCIRVRISRPGNRRRRELEPGVGARRGGARAHALIARRFSTPCGAQDQEAGLEHHVKSRRAGIQPATTEDHMTRTAKTERRYADMAADVLSSIARVARAGRRGDPNRVEAARAQHHALMRLCLNPVPETAAKSLENNDGAPKGTRTPVFAVREQRTSRNWVGRLVREDPASSI